MPRQLEGRWTLHVINDQRSAKKTLSTMPGIDFYYHDSGNSYLWQAFEYATVVRKMTGGGVFLSDDVDWSYAFIDHCETRRQKPTLMLEQSKVVGGYIVADPMQDAADLLIAGGRPGFDPHHPVGDRLIRVLVAPFGHHIRQIRVPRMNDRPRLAAQPGWPRRSSQLRRNGDAVSVQS